MTRSSPARRLAVLVMLLPIAAHAQPASVQPRFEDAVSSSFELATTIELTRTLPEFITVGDQSVTPAAWLQLAALAVANIAGRDTGAPPRATWRMPADPYPAVRLDDAVYGSGLSRTEYVDLAMSLIAEFPDDTELPGTLPLRDSDIRFVDAVHLIASVLRFHAVYEYLPSTMDPKISTPRGLFPWTIPDGMEPFFSAFHNENALEYLSTNEYYRTANLDTDYHWIARSLVDGIDDPYVAGETILEWAVDLYDRSPYGIAIGLQQFGHFVDSYEYSRNMHGTSGGPSIVTSGLYSAAGLVHGVDIAGYGGALYTEERGWYNAEFHARYGDDIYDNRIMRFSGGLPQPTDPYTKVFAPDDELFTSVLEVSANESETTPLRAMWVNPSDVDTYGAEAVLQMASEGGFTAVVLTVKSFVGRLYFETGQADNIDYDALGLLTDAAEFTPDLDVLVAIHTLPDYEMQRAQEWGQRFFGTVFGEAYSSLRMSPCESGYTAYLERLIDALYTGYSFDGLVLMGSYVMYDAWANASCFMTESTERSIKEARVATFANLLAARARSRSSGRRVYYLTGPLIGFNGTYEEDLRHDIVPEALDPAVYDGVILSINGLAFLTESNSAGDIPSRQVWNQVISSYLQQSRVPVHVTTHLSKEWMFGPEFYRGLAREYRSVGLDGIFVTGQNSGEGEFGPAFVQQHMAKLPRIRFGAAPPVTDVITNVRPQHETPLHTRLGVHPNPSRASVVADISLPSPGSVKLDLIDALGRTVRVLIDGYEQAGLRRVHLERGGLASGVYWLRLESGGSVTVESLVLH